MAPLAAEVRCQFLSPSSCLSLGNAGGTVEVWVNDVIRRINCLTITPFYGENPGKPPVHGFSIARLVCQRVSIIVEKNDDFAILGYLSEL